MLILRAAAADADERDARYKTHRRTPEGAQHRSFLSREYIKEDRG